MLRVGCDLRGCLLVDQAIHGAVSHGELNDDAPEELRTREPAGDDEMDAGVVRYVLLKQAPGFRADVGGSFHERQYSPRRPYLQQDRAKRLGAKRVVRIEGGHLPMLSKPDELAEVIAEFVSQAERKE